MNKVKALLNEKGVILADGAIGTNLFARGLETGDAPELWNLTKPDVVESLHDDFVTAGSDILLTNSFGGTDFRLKLHNAESQVAEVNKAAAAIARKSAEKSSRTILIAGGMGPTGELFQPLGMLDEASAFASFSAQADALAAGGVDLIWIETMSSLEEAEICVKAAKATGLPVFITMTFDTAGRTMMGVQPQDFAKAATGWGVDGFGANCGIGPSELLDSIFGMVEAGTDGPVIIAKGNCGIPEYRDGEIFYHGTAPLMADYARCARGAGAMIIGGCCGTSPDHLMAMHDALQDDAAEKPMDRKTAAARLGTPWASLKDAPNDDSSARDAKRRRRRRN